MVIKQQVLIKQPTDEECLSLLSTFGKKVLIISEVYEDTGYAEKGRPPGYHDKADAEGSADGDVA